MKIGVYSIIRDHFSSLYNAKNNRVSLADIFQFYLVPVGLSAWAYVSEFNVVVEFYSVSVTFFGIFTALLLNIQIAIFAIFQRKWVRSDDDRVAQSQKAELNTRRLLLGELNANISYLILVCCVALVAVLAFYAKKFTTGAAPSLCVFLYAHFLLTLLMIVKRSHALFQKEYRDSPS